ncbi:MAG: hypothetical protein HZR80_17850 [Candidatus Heimdallarchaeota archaeon]
MATHVICFYTIFNTEDHELALEFYKMETTGLLKSMFILNGVQLDIKLTAMKRHLGYLEYPQYGW